MTKEQAEQPWRVSGVSVRGAGHVRGGLPNQDALAWLPADGTGLPLSVAVADGHGSAKSFRSEVGARQAAELAAAMLQELLAACAGAHPSAVKRTVEESLPRELVRRWTAGVEEHLAREPFT